MPSVAGSAGANHRHPSHREGAHVRSLDAGLRRQRQAERLIAAWHAAHQEVLRVNRTEVPDRMEQDRRMEAALRRLFDTEECIEAAPGEGTPLALMKIQLGFFVATRNEPIEEHNYGVPLRIIRDGLRDMGALPVWDWV